MKPKQVENDEIFSFVNEHIEMHNKEKETE